MKQLAIIGPTASGKSDLAIKIAQKIDAYILSIDSLSIYKEIDIASAKPSKEELQSIEHFGINVLNPDEHFSVEIFIDIYKDIISTCQRDKKNLIIVGGTSFYLKSLMQGLSRVPQITQELSRHVERRLKDKDTYNFLLNLDKEYMKNISPNDSYRTEKALIIYEASGLTPTEWFKQNPPKPIIENLDIFNIDVQRALLRERIAKRTAKMIEAGILDEVAALEQKYTRFPHAMNSIGIVEVLEFLDGFSTKEQMIENISIHTGQLAKRQQTFNRTQFENITNAPLEKLEEIILTKSF
jgi:tRNA dimethylallyltransferase